MPTPLSSFIGTVDPSCTVLMFGAGASIPSGAPSVRSLQERFEKEFGISASEYNLAEQTGIIEQATKDRRKMIEVLQEEFKDTRPTGAILNLPLYRWKSIYTTNYDTLVEKSFSRRSIDIDVYSTNFDFSLRKNPDSIQYFKLHGTIDKDVSLGDKSRIIITQNDYDLTQEYRQQLYDRLKGDLVSSHLIIIGHSLADEDIRAEVNRAIAINAAAGGSGRISLLMYTQDNGRASLLEARGAEVVFGGLDDFFAGLVAKKQGPVPPVVSPDPLDHVTALRPSTHDAGHLLQSQIANVSGMYSGWPATYGDLSAGLTFQRNIADSIAHQLSESPKSIALILGPSGVGKTTAARQALRSLVAKGFFAWEHKVDQTLLPSHWVTVAERLSSEAGRGVLLVDEADLELPQLNSLIEALSAKSLETLKLVLVSTNHQWGPRVKSPAMFKACEQYYLNRVSGDEIDRLLNLIEQNQQLRALVETTFMGYSRPERRRRLTQRCEADMFVCLKNIFSSESFDHIILREYAELDSGSQEIYKSIAAMESAGVHVHRQLVIRLLGIPAMQIAAVLGRLEDIVHEEAINAREGIYAWRGRHKVIMGIIAEHKYYDSKKRYDLFDQVISAIRPTYDIEIRTIRELCNVETGLATIVNKEEQNTLLRKMISAAPGERVPRHRLIRNLIELGAFDLADTEIRIFSNDFGMDAPTTRYRINLAAARAVRGKGLLREDRIALIGKAREIAAAAAARPRYRDSRAVLSAYCEVGIEYAKLTGDQTAFLDAIGLLKGAEERVGDPEISQLIARLERRMSKIDLEEPETDFIESLAEAE